jgi:ribonuclease P protein component
VPKFGHSSVERNRLKRRLREIVRTELLTDMPLVDAVVRIRPSTYSASFSELREGLRNSALEIRRSFP